MNRDGRMPEGRRLEHTIGGAEQYDSAVARCEETAGNHGHTLGVWYPFDERFGASVCVGCGARVWITRPSQEKRWSTGGTALEQECP